MLSRMLQGPYHLLLASICISLVLAADTTQTAAVSSSTPTAAETSSSPSTAQPTSPTTTAPPTTTTTTVPTTTTPPPPTGILLPVMTMTNDSTRPNPIGNVSFQSGTEIAEHPHICQPGDQKAWTVSGELKNPLLNCDYDSTYLAEYPSTTSNRGLQADHCKTYITCDLNADKHCSGEPMELSTGFKDGHMIVDPHCHVPERVVELRHRWGAFELTLHKFASVHPTKYQAPPGDIFVRAPVKDPQTMEGIERDTPRFLAHQFWGGGYGKAFSKKDKDIPCKDGCHSANHIMIEYKKTERDIHVFLTPKCDWMTVCTAFEITPDGRCPFGSQVNIMLRNGFVAFDSRREQAPIRLHRYRDDGQRNRVDSITRIDLAILSSTTVDPNEKYAHMTVTSSWRQRAIGRIGLGQYMFITFSDKECLHPQFGIRAQEEVVVPTFKHEDDTYKKDVETANSGNKGVPGGPGTFVTAVGANIAEITTTAATQPSEFTAKITTTPAPAVADVVEAQPLAVAEDGAEKADRSGHATWGIFYGWLVGSLGAFIVMGPVMFFMRRTLYGNWYRGMYKRYGCDASGTTGGVTGASFGETTGGMQTLADGMTTGGGGATTGTTGGTTGGGTTASQTSQMSKISSASSGTSMITM